jgi:WD40 repeat protein/serine/threonine protein kinase
MTETCHPSRYTQLGEIARGGMGIVLRVRDRTLDRTLAMKRMLAPPSEDDGGIEVARFARFMEEAQITAQLDHPSIIPIHELGEDEEGRTYYTMRLVKGRALSEVLAEVHGTADAADGVRERLSPAPSSTSWNLPRLVGVLVRVCQTVAYAHAKGVIHRDLKPANIMVGDLGEVYVMDWGLARMAGRKDVRDLRLRLGQAGVDGLTTVASTRMEAGDTLLDGPLETMDGAILGTPAYMAPEQAAGRIEEVDFRSDVYALGAILYEVLAGHPPFMAGGKLRSPRAVLSAVCAGAPENLGQVNARIPPELVAICEKAMCREPGGRYASCLDLAEELQAFLDNRVVKAHQTGPAAEARAWVRRNPALALAFLVALGAIIGGLGTTAVVEGRAAARQLAALEVERRARLETVATLAESSYQQGVHHQAQGDLTLALAHWARALRYDPEHGRCAAHIAGVLLHESLPFPYREITRGHSGQPMSRFSPDNAELAVLGVSNTVEVFSVATGQRRLALPMTYAPYCLEFSPGGRYLVAAGGVFAQGGEIACWDRASGRQIWTENSFGDRLPKVAFDSEGTRVTAAMLDGSVRVWSVHDGRVIFSVQAPPDAFPASRAIHAAQLSRDGRRLLVGRGDGSLEMHDVDRQVRLFRIGVPGQKLEPVLSVAWSPDNSMFAAAGMSGNAQVYDAADGHSRTERLPHTLGVDQVFFDASGKRLLTSCRDGAARLWDVTKGALAVPPLQHQAALRWVGFNADGSQVVTACEDGTARIWSTATGLELARTTQRGDQVWHAELNPAGTLLATAGRQRGVVLWEVARPAAQPWQLSQEPCIAQTVPGSSLLAVAAAGKLRLLDTGTGDVRTEVTPHAGEPIARLIVSADGRWAATEGGPALGIRCWKLDGNLTPAGGCGSGESYAAVALSPQGRRLAVFTHDGVLKTWSTDALGQPAQEVSLSPKIWRMEIDDAGKWVALSGFLLTNFHWHLPEGRPAGTGPCTEMDRSVDGRWIVAADVEARFWDMAAGTPLPQPHAIRHRTSISMVRFSPDGRKILTVSADNTARIWDAASGKPLTDPMVHRYQGKSGCWSPDGRRIATTALDRTLTVWDAATGERIVGPLACPVPESANREESTLVMGFLPDGQRLLVRTGGRSDVWDLGPTASEPVPDWLAPLAEAVAGRRIEIEGEGGRFRTQVHEVPFEERVAWKERFRSDTAPDAYSRLARWFFADPAERNPAPGLPRVR